MNILLLGGSSEASALARALSARPWRTTLSLAGRTRTPMSQPVPIRIGGFGGVAGLAVFLEQEAIDALIDATHPFAAQITRHAAEAAAQTGTRLLRIDRPAWHPPPGASWDQVDTMEQAAASIGATSRRVLLTIGQKDLAPFRAAGQHAYVIRSIDPPADPPPGSILLAATGPFLEADERTLMQRHGIEVLVTKNAGGTATWAKLPAAAALGIRTVVVARPAAPRGLSTVATAEAALTWLEGHAGTRRDE